MYSLCLEYCAKVGAPTVISHYIYNEIFNTEFNLAFHTPFKDQCDFSDSYANACDEEKEKLSYKYENHTKNKDLVQKHKEVDKNKASSNADTAVYCFDLEEVLLTSHSFESCLYFKSRRNTFNFTVLQYTTSASMMVIVMFGTKKLIRMKLHQMLTQPSIVSTLRRSCSHLTHLSLAYISKVDGIHSTLPYYSIQPQHP